MKQQLLIVKVVPRASRVHIEPMLQGLKVWLTATPEDGAANRQLIEILADHLKVAKRTITIKSGRAGRIKMIEILN